MDPKSAWVERVLGVTVPSMSGGETPVVMTDETLRAELLARIREMVIETKLLPDKSAVPMLTTLATDAETAVGGEDLVAAEIAVDELEMALARAKSAARVAGAQNRKGMVNYRMAQVEWAMIRNVARDQLAEFGRMVKVDPEILADPLADEVLELADQFGTLMPQFDDELEELLETLDAMVDEEARAPVIKKAVAKLAEYRELLTESEGLAELQSLADDEYGGLSFFNELDKVLTKLQATLSV